MHVSVDETGGNDETFRIDDGFSIIRIDVIRNITDQSVPNEDIRCIGTTSGGSMIWPFLISMINLLIYNDHVVEEQS